ncbi:hypothetical protein [Horticoccus sp. 23ND18S-11]|uniref:hypothetical protein n=1 Tax=Horticoccus sp. 23ND18S-11 TaxID=3391832 RepID=UPI0039C98E94
MTSKPSPRVRPVCRVIRQWCVVTGQAQPRHAASCADCRAYFQTGDAVEGALRRDAGAWTQASPAPSAGFERELLRSIREEAAVQAPVRTPGGAWRSFGVAMAACAVVAGIGYVQFGGGTWRRDVPDTTVAAETAVVLETVESLSQGLVETVIPSAGALVADNPLQREFDSIYADARSVLGFLALNFLPTTPENAGVVPARRI